MVDRNVNLHAMGFFGSHNGEYTAIIRVTDHSSRICGTSQQENFLSEKVRSTLGDYQGFDVVFKPPIALEANTQYILSAKITGPPSWYGEGGQACVEHSGVKLMFKNHSSIQTKVECGQFSEFVFTLE